MKIGLLSYNTEYTMRADHLARAAEARGFESLWLPEHTHIPVPEGKADPETGMPVQPSGEFLEVEYRHMSDPFTSLAAAAAVTTTLQLGTCICLMNQHSPINLAKHVATLDRLSDGRFIFGIGAGWNVAEMGDHGVEFKDRWRQLRERLSAVRALWTEERAAFQGEYVGFVESWQYPKPLTEGGPKVILGTLDTAFGRRQVAQYGDGWLPLTFDIEETKKSIADVHRQMEELGRDPSKLEVSLLFLADEVQSADTLKIAEDAGVKRAIIRLPVANEDTVLRRLDSYSQSLG
jgi:probable F420-dependent oxidoreductase